MKKTITESQLRSIIAESVKKYISEAGMNSGFLGNHKYQPSRIEGYNGDPEGAEQWTKKHPYPQEEPHDDAWFKKQRSKGAVCENDCEEGLNTKGNVPARVNHNNKYPTSDEANASGFKKAEYQDFNKPYDNWHKGKETMKVVRDKNPKVSPSGYSWNGKPLEESYIKNAVSESIKNVLAEAEIVPSKFVDGFYDVNRITNPDFSIGDEYETGNGFHPFAHGISYKGRRIGTKLQGGRNIGRDYCFGVPDIEYGNRDGWGRIKYFDRADDYENYVEQNWDKIKELLDSGVRFD